MFLWIGYCHFMNIYKETEKQQYYTNSQFKYRAYVYQTRIAYDRQKISCQNQKEKYTPKQ